MLSSDCGSASSQMMILKLEARGAEDLGVCSHRPGLALTWTAAGCTGSTLGVVVTLTSGRKNHRKQSLTSSWQIVTCNTVDHKYLLMLCLFG